MLIGLFSLITGTVLQECLINTAGLIGLNETKKSSQFSFMEKEDGFPCVCVTICQFFHKSSIDGIKCIMAGTSGTNGPLVKVLAF